MRNSALLASLLLLALAAVARADEPLKALRFGRLVDGKGKVWQDAVVIVRGESIAEVTSGAAAIPAGAEVIDLRRYTGLPGLIDVHTHMTYYWDETPGTNPWSQRRQPAVTVFLAQENARRTLEAGVTTVRDLGALDYTDLALRELIHRGAMTGPRMLVAGHGLHVGFEPPQAGPPRYRTGLANTRADVERVVREQLAAGVDWIKMFGSTGSGDDVTGFQTFTYEEMRAGVVLAHQAGKRIAIHSYGPDGARDAVRASADSVEHGADLDDATLAEMARRGTFWVPTIDHNRYYVEYAAQFGYGPPAVARLEDYLRRNLETARRAHRAGVRFAMGSDAVFNMFGQNTRELAWFVQAGMTPEQALATATTNAAALLGMEERLGAVAPGYYADLVAVEGDPLTDIQAVIGGVRWVMKGGAVVVDKTKR